MDLPLRYAACAGREYFRVARLALPGVAEPQQGRLGVQEDCRVLEGTRARRVPCPVGTAIFDTGLSDAFLRWVSMPALELYTAFLLAHECVRLYRTPPQKAN
jgi:hypothetical protein